MKRLIISILTLFFIFNSYSQIEDKLYKEGDLDNLLSNIDSDSQLQIERNIAYHFHQLINQYRLTKHHKKTLYWDDRLWLAARNHNLFMNTDDYCGHNERNTKKHYSGEHPTDRVRYVTYYSNGTTMIGENVIQSNYDVDNIDVKAIAKDCFYIWKKSPGHNKNMLLLEYFAHGTAFHLNNGIVRGTSVFTYTPKMFLKKGIRPYAISDTALFKEKGMDYLPMHNSKKLVQQKMVNMLKVVMKEKNIALNLKLGKTAIKQVLFLKDDPRASKVSKKEKDKFLNMSISQKYLSVAKMEGRKKMFSHTTSDNFIKFDITNQQVENYTCFKDFEQKLITEIPIPENAKEWGGMVILENNANGYTCWVEIMYLVEKQ